MSAPPHQPLPYALDPPSPTPRLTLALHPHPQSAHRGVGRRGSRRRVGRGLCCRSGCTTNHPPSPNSTSLTGSSRLTPGPAPATCHGLSSPTVLAVFTDTIPLGGFIMSTAEADEKLLWPRPRTPTAPPAAASSPPIFAARLATCHRCPTRCSPERTTLPSPAKAHIWRLVGFRVPDVGSSTRCDPSKPDGLPSQHCHS